jgi:hypothetical protein
MMHITLHKERLIATTEVSQLLMDSVDLTTAEDYIRGTLAKSIEVKLLEAQKETQQVTLYANRPTFLDWLLRKPRSFKVSVNCREVMKNPPLLKDGESAFLYEVTK